MHKRLLDGWGLPGPGLNAEECQNLISSAAKPGGCSLRSLGSFPSAGVLQMPLSPSLLRFSHSPLTLGLMQGQASRALSLYRRLLRQTRVLPK